MHLAFVSDFNFKVCLATCNAMQVWREKHKQTSAHVFVLLSRLFREKPFNTLPTSLFYLYL